VSLDMGCVRISEQYLHSDPYAPEELSNAVAAVRDLVAEVPRLVPGAADAATLVGLAGTVTTVAAVELGIPEYDPEKIHHFRLTRDAAEDVFRTLATETAEQRAHNPGLEAGRVDVIVGGAAVLVGIFRVLGFEEMLVSEADILDGLVRSQAASG
jgi:exopolyphosphatase/guanosine-5'-triphosphate,3'-diphosphate pyrophosphatase